MNTRVKIEGQSAVEQSYNSGAVDGMEVLVKQPSAIGSRNILMLQDIRLTQPVLRDH